MTRIVAGLFDNRGDAERTVEHLIQELGVDPARIEIHGTGEGDSSLKRRDESRQGALRTLANLFLPREDYEIFREGIRRNRAFVAARVAEALTDRIMDIFEEYGATDLDARVADWRGAGWAPSQTGSTGHDEDIGFDTFGGDAVFRHIPRHHHDNSPAGLQGRLEMAAMRHEPDRTRARVRSYVLTEGKR